MNGGIPESEIGKLENYFKVFPNLKKDLFKKINDEYFDIMPEDLLDFINKHNDVIEYKKSYKEQFENFDDFLYEELIKNVETLDASTEEAKISEALFNRVSNVPLMDKYHSYQILDDNWNIISNDLEVINNEGLEACKKVDPIMESKKKGDKETEIQVGIKGRIIPIDLVIDEKLSNLKENLNGKENKLNDIDSQINEILENLTEDEKLEIDFALNDENDAFVPKEVAKKVKEYLNSEIMEGSIESKIIEVNNLMTDQKKLKKEIKDANVEIETLAQKEIENLILDDIFKLLNKKWIIPIIEGMDKQIDGIINEFYKQIEKLSTKYKQTLKDIDEEIKQTEEELAKMIDELTGPEYDMKGLEDFKALISGEYNGK